ncbi:MAG: dihydrodipicolinate synthase family protein [Anaerolineae bacterium]|nr:dihydrodipicolinate synthase family protein [Chloroflexota bacterium]
MIRGVFPPIATPFGSDGSLDKAALAENIRRWNLTGLSGYVVAGSNGESVLLEDQEVCEAVSTVRANAVAGQLVIAGVGRQSTRATISLTRAAAAAGAQVALVMNPSFFSVETTPEALYRHYAAVADASPIPVMVYNVPKFTHLNMAGATVARIATHGNIVGVKDSAGDIPQICDLVRLCPPGFDILMGNGPAFLSGLQLGAAGGILALANVAPRECVQIYQHAVAGEFEAARDIHLRLIPVGKAVTSRWGVPGLKVALELLGYAAGVPRLPLLPADDGVRVEMRSLLVEAGLLN